MHRDAGEDRALADLAQALLDTRELEVLLDRVVRHAVALAGADAASLALVSRDGSYVEVGASTESIEDMVGWRLQMESSLSGWVCRHGESVIANDILADDRADTRMVALKHLRRALIVPLTADGKPEGSLNVFASLDRDPFGDQDRRILERLSVYASLAIAQARRHEDEQRHLKQLRTLSSLARDVAQLRGLDELFPTLVRTIRSEFGYDHVSIFVREPETDRLVLRAITVAAGTEVGPGYTQSIDTGIVGRVARTGEHYLAQDTRSDPYYWAQSLVQRSELAVPIRAQGDTVGILNLESATSYAFDEVDVEVMQALGDLIGVAMENSRLVEDARQAERQKVQAEKLATIGQLVAGLAHEINNPLAAIASGAELLLSQSQPDEVRELLGVVRSETARATAIIRNVLDYARPRESELRELDLAKVVDAALSLRAHELKLSGIEVGTELPPLPPVLADGQRLQQVLLNLLVNAEQALADGTSPRSITIRATPAGDAIELRLSDSGPGIPAENLEKVFDPFFTTKPVGQGTGLGLSVSHGIIRELGGQIWAESGAEGGATFVVRLPLASQAAEPQAAEPAEPTAAAGAPLAAAGRDGARVLLVDDEASIRSVAARYLRRKGYIVELAATGEEALERFAGGTYDVVVTDLKMPGIGGEELYRRLVELDRACHDRILFMSGDIVSEGTYEFLTRTGRPYLMKPFDLSDLAEQIRAIAGPSGFR